MVNTERQLSCMKSMTTSSMLSIGLNLLPAQADSKLIQAFKRTRLTGLYQIVCWFHLKEKAVIQRQVIVSSTIYWS